MEAAIVFDCEFLATEGSPNRFWCAPHDPDPTVVQIGAVKIGLEEDFPILDTHRSHVLPVGRAGDAVAIDPHLTWLTGITNEVVRKEGLPLKQALSHLEAFADGASFWSWGKDEFNLLAISCYVEGISPNIPVARFGNAASLLLAAGMPPDDLKRTRSNELADYFKIDHPPLQAHDALDDARSVAFVLQALLRNGQLKPERLRLN